MRWRAWKEAYERTAYEWQTEVNRLQDVITTLQSERDEATRIAGVLIDNLPPDERELILKTLERRRQELRGD